MTKRRIVWTAAALILLVAAAVVFALAVATFSRDERAIARYCRESRMGDELAEARSRAEALGLEFKPHVRAGTGTRAVTVSADGSFWRGASFCSLHHDGGKVTAIFYNPWYH